MSYLVLARKWRPKNFTDTVGQTHVLRALSNALEAGRLHHAYLFAGTRGVGKTTIARILAKCLNCEMGPTANPCGSCSACREIDEGRFIDLIEVDAASNTKVDDTRELLDNVQYAPARGRFKVYLIDEVHMLSNSSFNALLKTLEEPPPHVKFLLATTDPHKLPVTVLSRCLQFNLKRLSVQLISGRMQHILDAEKVAFEPAALKLLAQAADGSLRDGLSLLDQLIAFGGGKVDTEAARAMLGSIDREHVANIGRALAAGEMAGVLAAARQLEEFSPDYAAVLNDLASLLQQVALLQVVPGTEVADDFDPELIAAIAGDLDAEDVQLYYQIAIMGRRDLALAPNPRAGFEMTLIRMLAFRPATGASTAAPPVAAPVAQRGAPKPSATTRARAASAQVPAADSNWPEILAALDLSGAARQLAANCALVGRRENVVALSIDPRHAAMATPAQRERLIEALGKYFGSPVKVEWREDAPNIETPARAREREEADRLVEARRSLEGDPTVQALQQRFGATLHPETVRPAKR
ncbi:MAG: DNA polymerase III subunit gamma/tau [Pseudomonadales bacterium]|nr:DNA polymerase III subunit gamma/tau [Pseudomonadales bacterium]